MILERTNDGLEILDAVLDILRTTTREDMRLSAATWLANRAFGKPIETKEISGPEGTSLRIIVEAPGPIVNNN